jgi:hypothetical protein
MYCYNRVAHGKRIGRGKEQIALLQEPVSSCMTLYSCQASTIVVERLHGWFAERARREAVLTMIEINTMTMLLQSINAKGEHFPNEGIDTYDSFN